MCRGTANVQNFASDYNANKKYTFRTNFKNSFLSYASNLDNPTYLWSHFRNMIYEPDLNAPIHTNFVPDSINDVDIISSKANNVTPLFTGEELNGYNSSLELTFSAPISFNQFYLFTSGVSYTQPNYSFKVYFNGQEELGETFTGEDATNHNSKIYNITKSNITTFRIVNTSSYKVELLAISFTTK